MKFNLNKNYQYLIAEIGWNFLGNLNLAKKMIRLAKSAGADAVKFQIWNPKNLKKGPWDKDGRRKLYEKSYLDKVKYLKLFNFSKKLNLKCFASVSSIDDMNVLASVSKEIVKIPSAEAYNTKLIQNCLKIFKQVIISTGCLKLSELNKLLKFKKNKKIVLLHCVSGYPLKDKNCNFKKFFFLKSKLKNVGYSGHGAGIDDALFAMANGAKIIEKHFTSNNNLPGRDNQFSLNPKEFKVLDEKRRIYKDFSKSSGLGIQKIEQEIFKKYRGRWMK